MGRRLGLRATGCSSGGEALVRRTGGFLNGDASFQLCFSVRIQNKKQEYQQEKRKLTMAVLHLLFLRGDAGALPARRVVRRGLRLASGSPGRPPKISPRMREKRKRSRGKICYFDLAETYFLCSGPRNDQIRMVKSTTEPKHPTL